MSQKFYSMSLISVSYLASRISIVVVKFLVPRWEGWVQGQWFKPHRELQNLSLMGISLWVSACSLVFSCFSHISHVRKQSKANASEARYPSENRHICNELISSPEHEVLMVSYCGQWLSVVRRRASCVVRRPSCVNIWCLHSRDHICDLILMKLDQNVCFNNI